MSDKIYRETLITTTLVNRKRGICYNEESCQVALKKLVKEVIDEYYERKTAKLDSIIMNKNIQQQQIIYINRLNKLNNINTTIHSSSQLYECKCPKDWYNHNNHNHANNDKLNSKDYVVNVDHDYYDNKLGIQENHTVENVVDHDNESDEVVLIDKDIDIVGAYVEIE